MTSEGQQALRLLPELILLFGAIGALVLGLWTPQDRQWRVRLLVITACLGSAIAAAASLGGPPERVFDDAWVIDSTTGIVRLLVALTVAGVAALASSSLSGHPRETEAYVLMLLGGLGAIALAGSGDLLLLAAAYLLASVPLYALAGFTKDTRGTEAALKYYLMGALVGVLMLLGIASLVLATGVTSYVNVAQALPAAPAPLVALGVLGVLAGVGFKAGAVPVHFWLPDVTSGTTPAMAAYITTIPKIGAVAAAFRLLAEPFATSTLDVPLLIAVMAAASMTLGNLAAFNQNEVLRLLAYSSISQVGYLLMVVAVAARSNLGVPALAAYLAGYAVTNVGAFAAAAAAPQARTISDWATTMRNRQWLIAGLVVCLLGLVGTPPTAVFVGKLAVFAAAWDGGLGWLVVVAAINTVASLFYYLRWIAPAVQGNPSAEDPEPSQGDGVTTVDQRILSGPTTALTVAAIMSVLLGVGSGVWLSAALPG